MSRAATASTPTPDPIQAVLALFQGELAEIQFPDVDREVLAAAAGEVERRQADLQRTLKAVQDAREALEAGQRALAEVAGRAHAYATVYARDKPELADAIAKIDLRGRALAPKKRGRPRKSKAESGKSQTSLSVAEDAA